MIAVCHNSHHHHPCKAWAQEWEALGMSMPNMRTPTVEMMLQMLNPAVQTDARAASQQNPGALADMMAQQNPTMAQMFQDNPAAAQVWCRHVESAALRSMIQMQQSRWCLAKVSGSNTGNLVAEVVHCWQHEIVP
jgi:hypothetical protein